MFCFRYFGSVISQHVVVNTLEHFYRPQRSWAKVIFLQASVCPQGEGEGCLPQCMLGYPPPWDTDPPGPGTHPQEQTHPPHQAPPLGADPPGPGTPPREADCSIRLTSSRYASYWNAFLLESS